MSWVQRDSPSTLKWRSRSSSLFLPPSGSACWCPTLVGMIAPACRSTTTHLHRVSRVLQTLMSNDQHQNDRLLDHAYDGIQEYDNPLPRWWVWIFYATIVFAVVYYFDFT